MSDFIYTASIVRPTLTNEMLRADKTVQSEFVGLWLPKLGKEMTR
jgi:hypothetical protein